MTPIRSLALACFVGLPISVANAQYSPGYTLIWSDEFDGNALDLTKWEPQLGDGSTYGIPGWGNNELQSYSARPENVFALGRFCSAVVVIDCIDIICNHYIS